MGFIDLDEFIVLADGETGVKIPEVLKPYEEYGGLGINLKIFGSSGADVLYLLECLLSVSLLSTDLCVHA